MRHPSESPATLYKKAQTPTPAQSADYTHDMLVSLRRLAVVHKQLCLARLIDEAAAEAKSLSHPAER